MQPSDHAATAPAMPRAQRRAPGPHAPVPPTARGSGPDHGPPLDEHFPTVLLVLAGISIAAVALLAGVRLNGPAAAILLPVAVPLAWRHPAAFVLGLFIVTGASGTLIALTPVQPRATGDFLLISLMLAALLGWLRADRRPLWLWPALLAPIVYVALTAIEVLLAEPVSTGLDSFRLTAWSLLAMLVIAFAPWAPHRMMGMLKAALIGAAAVCAYACLRWQIGLAPEEAALSRGTQQIDSLVRFPGPQPTPQQLAFWCAPLVPIAIAAAVAWRGRWRTLSLALLPMAVFLVIASEVRTGAVAIAAAAAVTLLLIQLSPAFPGGTRTGATITGLLAVVAIAGGSIWLTFGDRPERTDRFERLLTPGDDPAFSTRLDRWAGIWPEIAGEPLGHGLGTSGAIAERSTTVSETELIDSSYLKIGYEQGPVVMVGFALTFLALAGGLALRGISSLDPTQAALGIGGAGALIVMLLFFYAGNYVERFQALSGWVLVGLAVAAFTGGWHRPREPAEPGHADRQWPHP